MGKQQWKETKTLVACISESLSLEAHQSNSCPLTNDLKIQSKGK